MRKSDAQFIKATQVRNLLKARGEGVTEASKALGWADNTLSKYLNYRNKISKENLEKLASYLNQSPSTLINKHPTQKIIDNYNNYQARQTRSSTFNKEKTIAESINTNMVMIDRTEWELVKTLLANSANLSNTIIQKQNKLDKKIDALDKKVSEVMNCIKESDEKANTRQMYNVKLIKDLNQEISQLKLAARFNR